MTKRVYPVEGRWLSDVPAVEHDCDDDRCVETGAFTTTPPPKAKAASKSDPAGAGSTDPTEA